jgi:virginiamycin A acetyltransferase
MKALAKSIALAVALVLSFPAACLSAFGRWNVAYVYFAQAMAIVPGIVGSYLRVAYYKLTLESVGADCHIAFGSYFAHSSASLGNKVGIGSYCVLGQVNIGEGTLLASAVQILSGSRQHLRDKDGRLVDEGRTFQRISVGAHCWLGAGAIVMADLGDRATVGPGSVVSTAVPAGAVVQGNPARNFSSMMKPSS